MMTQKRCKTCHKTFEGEEWMFQCYPCYKSFKGMPRIEALKGKGVIILTHPSCTKEEVDAWIEKKYGSVNDCLNWGAVEITGKNRKVWFNTQNCD